MPVYVFEVAVPAGTLAASPVEQVFMLPVGTLNRVEIFFPPGPQGEVKVRMLLNGTQIYPSETGQWIAWDAGAVDASLALDVPYGENQVKVQVCSPNANFAHTITVKIDVSTVLQYEGGSVSLDLSERMARIMGGE